MKPKQRERRKSAKQRKRTEREGRTGEYYPSFVFERTSLHLVRTVTTWGQYFPVRPSRQVSKRFIYTEQSVYITIYIYQDYTVV